MEVPGLPVRPFALPDILRLRDVEMASEGRVSQGRAYTYFLPQGYATPTWIHLEDRDGDEYTVVVHPILGTAEIFDERIDAN